MNHTKSFAKTLVILLISAGCFPLVAAGIQEDALQGAHLNDGHRLFKIHCARCHGMLGAGGEGPNLKRAKLRRVQSEQELQEIILRGIPGTGMSETFFLSPDDVNDIATYVLSLGKVRQEPLPGNAKNGRMLFQNKGDCMSCHIVAGVGKGVGPELTHVGDQRGLEYLRQALVDPSASQPSKAGYADFLVVRITTAKGQTVGMRINEDAFSLQMRGLDGSLSSYNKQDLLQVERVSGHSLMPPYEVVFTPSDLDDIVSFLMTLRQDR